VWLGVGRGLCLPAEPCDWQRGHRQVADGDRGNADVLSAPCSPTHHCAYTLCTSTMVVNTCLHIDNYVNIHCGSKNKTSNSCR